MDHEKWVAPRVSATLRVRLRSVRFPLVAEYGLRTLRQRRCPSLTIKATSTSAPDTAMMAGLVGRSNLTDSVNPINPATSADTTDHKNTPAMLRDTMRPVTAGSTRKLNTSITPPDCIANAMTTPSVKYRSRFQTLML